MIEWLTALTLWQKVLGVGSLATVLAFTWKTLEVGHSLYHSLKSGMAKLAVFEPEQLATCVADVAAIKATLGPNGGASLYDRITTAAATGRLANARLSTVLDVVVNRPMFEARPSGDYAWVNAEFESVFEVPAIDVVGRGWINLLLPEDRTRVVQEWRHAVQDCRSFSTMARVVSQRSGAQHVVRFKAEPLLEDQTRQVIAYLGTIDPVSTSRPHPKTDVEH